MLNIYNNLKNNINKIILFINLNFKFLIFFILIKYN
jgi:hypothetical protein